MLEENVVLLRARIYNCAIMIYGPYIYNAVPKTLTGEMKEKVLLTSKVAGVPASIEAARGVVGTVHVKETDGPAVGLLTSAGLNRGQHGRLGALKVVGVVAQGVGSCLLLRKLLIAAGKVVVVPAGKVACALVAVLVEVAARADGKRGSADAAGGRAADLDLAVAAGAGLSFGKKNRL